MKKLYQKSELALALVWIGLYVVIMNIALQFCGGFDDLAGKTAAGLLIPVVCITLLAAACTLWILNNGLSEQFGLCRTKRTYRQFLWYVPLVVMSCVNLTNGVYLPASVPVAVLMAINLALGGYVEEIIFRGFLFRAMERDKLSTAIIVSAVTFGAGHIVNLVNTADIFGVLLQVCYAIVIGFLYTVIAYKGGSLLPCIASHMFVNATSVFALEQGPFTEFATRLLGLAAPAASQILSAAAVIAVAGSYALWLWIKA